MLGRKGLGKVGLTREPPPPKGEDKTALPGATAIKGTPTQGLGKVPL